jgi:hypothetical protein
MSFALPCERRWCCNTTIAGKLVQQEKLIVEKEEDEMLGAVRLVRIFFLIVLVLALGGSAVASGDYDGEFDREFKAKLTGAEEVPPVDTAARGQVQFHVNRDQTQIEFNLKIERATAILSAAGAHIHCAPAGTNGPVVAFLAGPVTGGFNGKVEIKATLTAANITNPACGATIADLVQSMTNGNTYVNAHSVAHPTGEIRGQVR